VGGIVRRDRLRLAIWLLAVPLVTVPTLSAYGGMFETEASAQARAAVMGTATGTVFGGPGYGLDHYTTGPMIANELLLYLDITVALAAILLTVHLTRREEETGRLELVGAAAVGRRAPLAAAMAVVAAEVALIGLALGFGSMLYPDLGKADCLAFGLVIAATGLAFTGVGAVAAQIAGSGRGAAGLGAAALGAAFLLRAAGDTATVQGGSDWASWVSPLGWANRTRVFVDTRWWPILLPFAFALVAGAAAWLLAGRRDAGAGLVATQRGPARADKTWLSLSGLAWRRTRGGLFGWAGGALALALAMGPVISDMRDYLADNPVMAAVLGVDPAAGLGSVVEGFSALLVLYMAMLMAAYAITAVNALHGEETESLVSRQLAEPVRRWRLLAAWEATAAFGALLGTALAGVAYLLVVAMGGDVEWDVSLGIGTSALRAFPGLVLTVALAAFLVAAAPRWTALSWVPFAYSFVYVILGPVLDLPDWCRYLSPLSAVPYSAAEATDWGGVGGLLVVAAALLWAAHRRFRARDLLA
jgi:ABC-2 type transport system permease protein